VGLETQRLVTTSIASHQESERGSGRAPRSARHFASAATNAREPARTVGDTAGVFRVPAAFTNARRLETVRRSTRDVWPKRCSATRRTWRTGWVISPGLDVTYSAQQGSSFSRATDTPVLRLPAGTSAGSRLSPGGRSAGDLGDEEHDAVDRRRGGASTGLRANATYRITRGILWTLRTDAQVPIAPGGGMAERVDQLVVLTR